MHELCQENSKCYVVILSVQCALMNQLAKYKYLNIFGNTLL